MQASPDAGALARVLGVVQGSITVGMAAGIGIVWGVPYALAALFGGLCALLPMGYFAMRVSLQRGAEPADVAGAAFRGEIGKMAMTIVLLWLGVTMFAAQFMALLATYGACLLAYGLVMARLGFASNDKG